MAVGRPITFGTFSKDYTNPRDREFRAGKSPYKGSLGHNKTPENWATDQWTASMRDNPDWKNFWSDAYTFPGDNAAAAQQKVDDLAWITDANFGPGNEGQTAFANNFLAHYLDKGDGNSAEGRGLIEDDRIVKPENLDQVATSTATSANAVRDPNVVGKTPSNSVVV